MTRHKPAGMRARHGARRTAQLWLVLAAAALAIAAAQSSSQTCSIEFAVTLHNFNKLGNGANSNADFGFLPEPANISDKKIIKATLGADSKPVYNPATGFNTSTTHNIMVPPGTDSQLVYSTATSFDSSTPHGSASFDAWFNTPAAYQQDAEMTLPESTGDNDAIRFAFSQAAFYPLNGQLLGASSPGANNRYYTLELHTTLNFLEASAGAMTFSTNGDLFVFMNGERVINLGGVHATQEATLIFDELGLQDKTSYPVDIFMAQRHAAGVTPNLDITTSVDFVTGKTAAAVCASSAGRTGGDTAVSADGLSSQFPPVVAPPANGFPGVAGCNAVWGVAGGDSCSKIATKSGLEGVAALLAFNPGLNCSGLAPGQLVCTGTGGAPTATCGFRVYVTSDGDSCLTVREAFGENGVPIKFAVLQALNPDMDCGSDGQAPLPAETNICLPVVPGSGPSTSRRRLAALGDNSSGIGLSSFGVAASSSAVLSSAAVSTAAAAEATSSRGSAGRLHYSDLLQGWTDVTSSFRRLQASAGACIGTSITVQQTSCSLTCASAAEQAGLTVTQLTLLNPQLLDNPSQTCRVSAGQTLCKGCSGTVCGVKLSDELSEFLNFPDLNLLMCGLLADCSNEAYVEGSAGAQDEQLLINIAEESASTSAYTAAGGKQIAAFFDPEDGYYNTNPGSFLSLSIYPSYYDGVPKVAKGGNAGLVSFVAIVILTPAQIAEADGTGNSTSGARLAAAPSGAGGVTASPTGNAVGLQEGDTSGGVGDGSDGSLSPGGGSTAGGAPDDGGNPSSSSVSDFPARGSGDSAINSAGRRKLQAGPGRTLLGFRLPKYRGKKRYRYKSQNPTTMVISRYRRIW